MFKISDREGNTLLEDILDEFEIKITLFSLNGDSVYGCDGMSSLF